MITRKLNAETSELEVLVTADTKKWADAQDAAFKKIKGTISIKGFRKGQAPDDIVKKQINSKEIMSNAIEKILEELAKESHASLTEEDKILDSPTYDIETIGEKELVVKFIYPLYPTIKLGEYKGLKVEYKEEKTDEKEVEKEVDRIRERKSLLIDKKGPIAKNDTAIFDFEGFVEGNAFDGGKAERYSLVIGSNQFIPGFEDQMIGLKTGDEKDIKVKFPKDYHAENLKDKEATFKVKVHEIKSKELPELNDDFVKELKIEKAKNVKELKEYIADVRKKEVEAQAKIEFQKTIFDKIKSKTNIVIPRQLINKESSMLLKNLANSLKQQGLDIQKYLELTKTSKEKLQTELTEQAKSRLTDTFIFAEIAKLENIKVTDEEVKKQYEKFAELYKKSVDEIKKLIQEHQVHVPIINEKVIDFLITNNKK